MKYLFYTVLSLGLLTTVAYAAPRTISLVEKLLDPPVWEYKKNLQNINTDFTSKEQVKVFKFDEGNNTCYISLNASIPPQTAISCITQTNLQK